MAAALRVDRERVLAFRLAGHHLARRLPPGSLVPAAAACGMRDTPPGSALLGFHARVDDVTADALDATLGDRVLVGLYGPRGARYLVPVGDLAAFTVGALPADEASLRHPLYSGVDVLDQAGIPVARALIRLSDVASELLDGRTLSRAELSGAMAERVPPALAPWCPRCRTHHPDETLFRLVGLRGVYCFAAPQDAADRVTTLARLDQWLDRPAPDPVADREAARAELLRRYLRCYGPSRPADFAAWADIGRADARTSFDALGGELVEVAIDGRRAWLVAADRAALDDPPAATGIRLLPPNDPYLLLRDRETLMPDKAARQRLWRANVNPGAVLLDGRLVASWRARKQGAALKVSVSRFVSQPAAARSAIDDEAQAVAALRACRAADVVYEP